MDGAGSSGLLVYPFLDRWLGFQTVHAVSDGMIYVLLALGPQHRRRLRGPARPGLRRVLRDRRLLDGAPELARARLAALRARWSFWVCIWIAAAVSALLGVIIGSPDASRAWRLSRHHHAGFGEIIPVAIRNLGDITIDIAGGGRSCG